MPDPALSTNKHNIHLEACMHYDGSPIYTPNMQVSCLGSSMKGGDSHEGDDGGAVGVGNDTPLPIPHPRHGVCIHLGNDQWHSLCHPEG